jgi:hypothetical protein
VEANLSVDVPSEHTIEYDNVKVEVRVEAGTEPMKEAQRP